MVKQTQAAHQLFADTIYGPQQTISSFIFVCEHTYMGNDCVFSSGM